MVLVGLLVSIVAVAPAYVVLPTLILYLLLLVLSIVAVVVSSKLTFIFPVVVVDVTL